MATIIGTSGDNTLNGTAGSDSIFGLAGNDTLRGLQGTDLLDGGAGFDAAAYNTAASGVTVNLNLAGFQNTGGGGSDRLVSIENLIGSNFNDTLTGNSADNLLVGLGGFDTLTGGSGNDRLNGGLGNDLLNGGLGIDFADYSNIVGGGTTYIGSTSGVTVNLNLAGAQNTGGAGIDTLVSIEDVIGTNFNDVLTGNSGNNRLFGLEGNDTLNGGSGNDRLDGGTGSDTASYAMATAGVTVGVDFLFGEFFPGEPQNTGGAGIDTLLSIENLTGSNFNDRLLMSGVDDDVTLNGGNGNDKLESFYSVVTMNGEAGDDFLSAGDAGGTLNGGTGNDHLIAGLGAYTLIGGDGNDLLEIVEASPFGNTVNGEAGADTVDLSSSGTRVIIDYNAVTDSPAGTGRDKILGFSAGMDDNLIDLSTIDANALVAGNQAFIFGGSFTAGHLRYVGGVLQGNTDGDAAAEFEIQLVGAPALTVGGASTDILL